MAPNQAVDWVARARSLSERLLAPLTDIHERDGLPDDVWQAMAEEGLLGLTLPKAYGGQGVDAATKMRAVAAFVRASRSLGAGSIWQSHLGHTTFVVDRLGTEAQKARYLPGMARGEETMAVSISEPKVGAHPKRLTTAAEPDGDGWRLYGEKSYLTQGPRATVIAVLAITAVEQGIKRYSVFLVPQGAEGMTLIPGGNVDYLKPSSHCGMKLDGVRVGPDALIGPLGKGYDVLAKPMRDYEDLLNMGGRFGAFAAELDIAKQLAGDQLEGDAAARFGSLAAALDGLKALSAVALSAGPGSPEAEQLLLDMRNRMRWMQAEYGALIEQLGVDLPPRETSLKRDMDKLGDLAGYVQKIRLERLAAAWEAQ